MSAVTIRNLPPDVHEAIKKRASLHGRSTEAEIRTILQQAVQQAPPGAVGRFLLQLGREVGGVELETTRDQTPAGSSVRFE